MDISESTRIVFQRIQKLDPENVTKIIGHLLLDDRGEQEMIRLAFGPDNMIQSLIEKVRKDLGLSPKPLSIPDRVSAPQEKQSLSSKLPLHFTPFTPASSRDSLPSPAFLSDNGQWDPQVPLSQPLTYNTEYHPTAYLDSATSQLLSLEDQWKSLSLTGPHFQVNNHCHELAKNTLIGQGGLPFFNDFHPSIHEFSVNICEQFNQGYCKYGAGCKSLHVLHLANGHDMVLNPPSANNVMNNYHVFRHRSLKDLEMEIIELLKTRRGLPVLISSIPKLYHEKYGRTLQAEYYHMENQWKGNVIYGLIQLAQISDSICLVDRPNGQHSLILVDDIPRYMRSFKEKIEPEESADGSCRVYLTFTPECVFNEQDIYCYFNNFGPVKEVKIPSQEKTMYGFVTFAYPETAKLVLTKGNPHFIRGAQILVKPYKPRSMLFDRKPEDKMKHGMQNTSLVPDAESKPISNAPVTEIEDTDPGMHHSFFSYTFDGFSLPKEGVSSNDFKSVYKGDITKICNDDDCEQLILPDSPFRCEAGCSSSFFL